MPERLAMEPAGMRESTICGGHVMTAVRKFFANS